MKINSRHIGAAALAVVGAACVGLAVASGALAARELRAAVAGPDDGARAALFWISPPGPFPIDAGSRQQRRLMAECLSLVAARDFAFHDAEVRAIVASNCAAQARHAMGSGTTISEAAALLAVESIERGDLAGADDFLRQSRAMAPTDIGMILHRISIGFRAFPAEVLAGPGGLLEREMPVLIGSGRGVSAAASLYVQVPELRPVVDRIADALPATDRQRFLRAVQGRVNG